MKHNLERGDTPQGLLLLGALCIILFVFIIPSHKVSLFDAVGQHPYSEYSNTGSHTQTNSTNSTANNPASNSSPERTSRFSGRISINPGNAASAYQPYEEYIVLRNTSPSSIDITGWKLSNARNTRTYLVGNTPTKFSASAVTIPQATRLLTTNGGVAEDVVLAPNESATLVTGSMGTSYPYKITSFKENKCSGYLGTMSNYTFSPYLSSNCPAPGNEPGSGNLDQTCQSYLRSMTQCHTPEYNGVDQSTGQACNGCVDHRAGLSSSCVAYIQSHFSYPGCIAAHSSDSDFSGTSWRIFLGQSWDLWAADHETITLFDGSGNVVDYYSY